MKTNASAPWQKEEDKRTSSGDKTREKTVSWTVTEEEEKNIAAIGMQINLLCKKKKQKKRSADDKWEEQSLKFDIKFYEWNQWRKIDGGAFEYTAAYAVYTDSLILYACVCTIVLLSNLQSKQSPLTYMRARIRLRTKAQIDPTTCYLQAVSRSQQAKRRSLFSPSSPPLFPRTDDIRRGKRGGGEVLIF